MLPTPKPELQRGRLRVRIGRVDVSASVKVTPTGLLSIGALVSGVLLSTAVLVGVAVREGKRVPDGRRLPEGRSALR